MTAAEFRRELKLRKEVTNETVYGSTSIGNLDGTISISNCTFENTLVLNQNEIAGLRITNCIFKKALHIFNLNSGDLLEISGTEADSLELANINSLKIEIYNSILKRAVVQGNINDSSGSRNSFEFESSTINDLLIDCDFLNAELSFLSGSYNQVNIEIKSLSRDLVFTEGTYGHIILSNSKFEGTTSYSLYINSIKSIFIQSCEFEKRVDFESNIEEWINIHKVDFNEQVIFHENFACNSLDLSDVFCKRSLSISYSYNFKNLRLTDCNFPSNFNFYTLQSSKKEKYDHYLSCDFSGINNGNIIFEDSEIPYINLGGINLGNILFNNIKTTSISIRDFQNRGELTFSNITFIEGYTYLFIIGSSAGRLEFLNVDLRNFDELVILKSNISDTLFSNTLLPDSIQIEPRLNKEKFGFELSEQERNFESTYLRESYRQLKLATEKQSNKKFHLHYKSKEMAYLRKETKFGFDKILLTLNWLSNNHGISWRNGFYFTFSLSLFFSLLMSVSSKSFEPNLSSITREYLNFMSSFPSFNTISKESSLGQDLIIILSRIFIGYGIYQTIVSFRKYGGR